MASASNNENGDAGYARHKYTQVDVIFFGIPVTIIDLLAVLLLFVGLDDFGLIDAVLLPVTNVYYFLKNDWKWQEAAVSGGEVLPWVGDLPLYSLRFWIKFGSERNWKVAKIAKVLTSKGKGASEALGEVAGKETARTVGKETAESLATERPPKDSPPPPTTGSGTEVSERAFGMPEDNPVKEAEEELLGGDVVDLGAWQRRGRGRRAEDRFAEPVEEGASPADNDKEEELEVRTGSAQAEITKLKKGLSELPSDTIDLRDKNAA